MNWVEVEIKVSEKLLIAKHSGCRLLLCMWNGGAERGNCLSPQRKDQKRREAVV